ncbi:MAG: helix-turn-helix transcriptional regulator [Kangiellaceae bacterium]|nr:helix-turn-helix transcriptional regulator [Kangiellaceae bacterium]
MKKIAIDDPCPVARSLAILGEKWTILILRNFFQLGPQKYQNLQKSLSGISPNSLSDRLKKLEEYGLIETSLYQKHPPRNEYSLTNKGRGLGPILQLLKKWGGENTVYIKETNE